MLSLPDMFLSAHSIISNPNPSMYKAFLYTPPSLLHPSLIHLQQLYLCQPYVSVHRAHSPVPAPNPLSCPFFSILFSLNIFFHSTRVQVCLWYDALTFPIRIKNRPITYPPFIRLLSFYRCFPPSSTHFVPVRYTPFPLLPPYSSILPLSIFSAPWCFLYSGYQFALLCT
jgi:hypothetical protein